MKKNNSILLWIIGLALALLIIFTYKPDMGLQAIIGSPGLSYSYNFDEDAPVQEKMMFGSDEFKIHPTSFNFEECGKGKYGAPEPSAECWTTNVDFQGNNIEFHYGETKKINDFFLATFRTNADVRRHDEEHEDYWVEQGTNLFSFEMYNKDFLEASIPPQNTLLLFKEKEKMKIKIRNDLANNLEGGLTITTSNYLENQVPRIETKKMVFQKGTNEVAIDLDTGKMGKMNIKIRPFITIMGVDFHDDRAVELTFNVVPFIDKGAFSVDCTETECGKGFRCEPISYEGDEYNICIKSNKGETESFNEWSLENLDLRIVVGLFIILSFIIYFANRRSTR